MDTITLERPLAQRGSAAAAPATSRPTSRPSDTPVAFLQAIGPTDRHNLVAIFVDGRIEGRTFEPGAWTEIAVWIEARLISANLYFSQNEPGLGAPHKKLAKTDICAIRTVSVDLDPGLGDFDAERQVLLDRLQNAIETGGLPQPTVVVDSGNGYQAHWLLADKVSAKSMTVWAEDQARAFAVKLGGDSTQNVDRVLRLPGHLESAERGEAGTRTR